MRSRAIEVGAGAALAVALALALSSPPDAVQGDLTRIMYVHVPSAWLAYLAFGVTLVGSAGYLITRRLKWDHLAASSAELGVFFTALTLALGMIWGKPVWGVWWTWDARLTLTAIMFFVYLGYLALRRSVPDPTVRARRSAILGVVAVVQVPLVHFSVTWWRGLHQPPTLLRPGEPQIDTPLLVALLVAVGAFSVVYAALLRRRMHLERLDHEIHLADSRYEGVVAGDAVTAPDVEPAVGGPLLMRDEGDRHV